MNFVYFYVNKFDIILFTQSWTLIARQRDQNEFGMKYKIEEKKGNEINGHENACGIMNGLMALILNTSKFLLMSITIKMFINITTQ